MSDMEDRRRVCWVITGAGHFLRETAGFLTGAKNISGDLYYTRAGREVAAMYRVTERIGESGFKIFYEDDFSSRGAIYFSGGRYRALVIAPATANTIAKCALGIADSLSSNFFAQAGKSSVPIFVLPTDAEREISSVTPSGVRIEVIPRRIDLARIEELRSFSGVTVLRSPEEFYKI
ncbi:MAG: flavoprotein [Synergistaceae bacterium]|jgi:flavoprotein|nr:flavoprotein [Synergistaceae bacterium]